MSGYVAKLRAFAGRRDRLGGDGIHDWDPSRTFFTGEVVRYWGRYWRARRDVVPPFWQVFSAGEVPGESDAWIELTATEVVDLLGARLASALGHGGGPQRGEEIEHWVQRVTHTLGDMGTGGAPSLPYEGEYGPLSPEQLSLVTDRKLTPDEQRAVDDWRRQNAIEALVKRSIAEQRGATSAEMADAYRRNPRAQEGVQRADVQPAHSSTKSPSWYERDAFFGLRWWQVAGIAAGVAGIGAGILVAARSSG